MEIINASTGAVITDTTKVPSNTSIKFHAKIKNQNGAIVPSTQSFNNQFSLDGNTTDNFANRSIVPLVGSDVNPLSLFITSFVAPTFSIGSHSLQVCADNPLGSTGRGDILEINNAGNAEQNNCLTSPFSFSVVTPISVQLECENQGGVYKNNYCIIDYGKTSNLRWTVGGAPSSCSWVASDVAGSAANRSYTVTGNPFSLNNLLDKISFKYQLKCMR